MVKLDCIVSSLWVLWKEPSGYAVITLMGTFWKNSWWVAQVLDRHIVEQIVNGIKGFFHKVPSGHIEVWIVKEIKGYFYKVLPGYFEEHIVNKFKEFFHKMPSGHCEGWIIKELKGFFHKVSAMHLGEYFLKVLTMCLVGVGWAFCFRTHNELIMCLLGKCTLAPSVYHHHRSAMCMFVWSHPIQPNSWCLSISRAKAPARALSGHSTSTSEKQSTTQRPCQNIPLWP